MKIKQNYLFSKSYGLSEVIFYILDTQKKNEFHCLSHPHLSKEKRVNFKEHKKSIKKVKLVDLFNHYTDVMRQDIEKSKCYGFVMHEYSHDSKNSEMTCHYDLPPRDDIELPLVAEINVLNKDGVISCSARLLSIFGEIDAAINDDHKLIIQKQYNKIMKDIKLMAKSMCIKIKPVIQPY